MTDQLKSANNQQEEEITLRCNKCGKPITPAEAVQTPIGYRCPDCVRQQQKVYDTSKPQDYILGIVIAAVLSFLGSLLVSVVGFFIFLLAPAIGVGVSAVVRSVVKKRRSKTLFRLVAYAMIAGGLPLLALNLITLVTSLGSGVFSLYRLLPLAYQVLYLVLAVPSAYYRLSGSRRL